MASSEMEDWSTMSQKGDCGGVRGRLIHDAKMVFGPLQCEWEPTTEDTPEDVKRSTEGVLVFDDSESKRRLESMAGAMDDSRESSDDGTPGAQRSIVVLSSAPVVYRSRCIEDMIGKSKIEMETELGSECESTQSRSGSSNI